MPQSRNINTYGDIKRQLEHCRALGGAKIEFDTFGQATVWMARAYTFRALLRKQAEAAQTNPVPGWIPSTPWDDMIIRHNKKDRETFLRVEFNAEAVGKISPLDNPGAIPNMTEEADTLLASIKSLAKAEGQE